MIVKSILSRHIKAQHICTNCTKWKSTLCGQGTAWVAFGGSAGGVSELVPLKRSSNVVPEMSRFGEINVCFLPQHTQDLSTSTLSTLCSSTPRKLSYPFCCHDATGQTKAKRMQKLGFHQPQMLCDLKSSASICSQDPFNSKAEMNKDSNWSNKFALCAM